MIKKLRVDHRLLHGQVAFSWTQAIGADCILIANDDVFQDPIKMSAIRMGKPAGVKVVIKTMEEAVAALKSGVTDRYRLFIVVESVADAKRIAEETGFHEINLGGMKDTPEKTKFGKAVYLTQEEMELVRALIQEGFHINMQMIPADKEVKMETLL